MQDVESLRAQLLAAAREARHYAYAPYSGYAVGAVVCDEEGRVFSGANVENASYGLTMCAERVALFRAVSEGVRRIVAVAVVTRDGAPPCGACRQVLAEFADEGTLIWCASEENGQVEEYRLAELLPFAFRLRTQSSSEEEFALGGM